MKPKRLLIVLISLGYGLTVASLWPKASPVVKGWLVGSSLTVVVLLASTKEL